MIVKWDMLLGLSGIKLSYLGFGILSFVISEYPEREFSIFKKERLGRSFSNKLKLAFLDKVSCINVVSWVSSLFWVSRMRMVFSRLSGSDRRDCNVSLRSDDVWLLVFFWFLAKMMVSSFIFCSINSSMFGFEMVVSLFIRISLVGSFDSKMDIVNFNEFWR